MKAEIITIGTELLLGQIINTNTAFLSRELSSLGIEIYHHTSVGDNPERLRTAIIDAENRADLLVFTGGLGPTKDDITKKVIAGHLEVDLIDEEESKKSVEKAYEGLDMPQNNYNQSQILEGSEVLANTNGMAPGVLLEKNKHIYVMLPGVPSEMVSMVKNQLIPKLRTEYLENQVLESRLLRFYGITESRIAEKLDNIIENQTNPTIAIYVDNQEITVRVTAKAESVDEAEKMIDEVEKLIQAEVSEYFFGYGIKNLPEVIHDLLIERNLNLSFIELGTDGYISSQFTENLEEEKIFQGSLVLNEVELVEKLLSVPESDQNEDELFSEQAAKKIADKSAEVLNSDIGISIISSSEDEQAIGNSAGKFWVGLSYKGQTLSRHFDFSNRKNRTRRHFLLSAMNELRVKLLEIK